MFSVDDAATRAFPLKTSKGHQPEKVSDLLFSPAYFSLGKSLTFFTGYPATDSGTAAAMAS